MLPYSRMTDLSICRQGTHGHLVISPVLTVLTRYMTLSKFSCLRSVRYLLTFTYINGSSPS